MLSQECRNELHNRWLPNLTDGGLDRLIELLEKGSPHLLHGCFSRLGAMGCLATQAAWHHPRTEHLHHDAGVAWIENVVGLHPVQSQVIREWDAQGSDNFEMRQELLVVLKDERTSRQHGAVNRVKQFELV